MYNVSVLAMFKNESWIIKEWLEHYLQEGIEHFYLIDNGSDDDYLDKIQPYIVNGKITLIKDPYRQKLGTQDILYNKHFLKQIKEETIWIIVADMDEYIYARNGFKTISEYLSSVPPTIGKIVLPWKLFGSNGIITHPNKIIPVFTQRQSDKDYLQYSKLNRLGYSKTIARTTNLNNVKTHDQCISSGEVVFSDYTSSSDYLRYDSAKQFLHINHYTHLSLQYYNEIKIKRGGGQGGVYDMARFNILDEMCNAITDMELSNKKLHTDQNKRVGSNLM